MSFLLVDRLLEVVPGERAVGLKNVSISEPGLVQMVPGCPVLPQAHTAEAIAHCISWLVIVSLDFGAKPIAVTTQEMLFDGWARPGDQIRLEATIHSLKEDSALCSGRAVLGEQVLATMKNGICAFVPIGALEDEVLVRTRYRFLSGEEPDADAVWADEGLEGRWPLVAGQLWPYPYVDRVVAWEPGKRLVAAKAVTHSDAMLKDHFPKRPVLPGTVMAEALGQAGLCLIERGLPGSEGYPPKARLVRVKKARFRQFLHPGDLLIMEAEVRRWEEDEAELALVGTVDGQEAVRCQGFYRLEAAPVPPALAEAREAIWRARFEAEEGVER
jgi:3-hydroxyacyl-[acyl-carrier-protein] dehydratase